MVCSNPDGDHGPRKANLHARYWGLLEQENPVQTDDLGPG